MKRIREIEITGKRKGMYVRKIEIARECKSEEKGREKRNMCVCERERERERESKTGSQLKATSVTFLLFAILMESVKMQNAAVIRFRKIESLQSRKCLKT